MYEQSMQRLKVNCLKLSPPLLLGMLEGRKEEEEKRHCEEVEMNAGFCKQEEEITEEESDAREATKSMKDMDIN